MLYYIFISYNILKCEDKLLIVLYIFGAKVVNKYMILKWDKKYNMINIKNA